MIHERARPRYRCKACGKRFSAFQGTMFEGLRKPKSLIVIVITLLTYGCPLQAIVHALDLDERTVAAWRDRAGLQCQKVHEALVEQGQLDLVHVQADEIRVKGRSLVIWMGLAMMVSTRLWLAGAVSHTRDRRLADRLLLHVRACAQPLRALLVATDGWASYPKSIKRACARKSERNRRKRKSLLTHLEGLVYRDSDQTDREETRGGSHTDLNLREAGTGQRIVAAVQRRFRVEHRLH